MRFLGRKHRRHPMAMLHPVNVYDYNHPPASVIGQSPWIWDMMSQRWVQSPYLTVAAPVGPSSYAQALPVPLPVHLPLSGEMNGIF